MKNVMKRRIAEETTEKNGRLSLSELKLMMMIIEVDDDDYYSNIKYVFILLRVR